MDESNFLFRINSNEKALLKRISEDHNMSINDYIRLKLFTSNLDLSGSEAVFESPAISKHNYLTARVLQDVYMMLLQIATVGKTAEEAIEIKDRCRKHAENNIAKLGYLKIENKPKEQKHE